MLKFPKRLVICLFMVTIALPMATACTSGEPSASSIASPEIVSRGVTWPVGQWPRSSPSDQGMDADKVQAVVDVIDKGNHQVDSMLIVRNGYIVKEKYAGGYEPTTRHQIYSVTKSVLSALIGIALEEGAISSLDQPIVDFFPALKNDPDPIKQTITIKHLLTMTSGIDWPELSIPYTSDDHPLIHMYDSPNQIEFILKRDMASAPGAVYNYSTADSHLLSAILQQAVGQTAEQYAETKLFGPLGITNTQWPSDNQGVSLGGAGLFMLPEDMARFGYLYLHRGMWVDEQIVPEAWIEQSTTLQATGIFKYGYQWRVANDGDYYAMGYRGQFILVSPSRDLVVVFTSDMNEEFMPLTLFDLIKGAVNE